MTKVSESDLAELKAFLSGKFETIDTRLTAIDTRLTSIETGQIKISEKVDALQLGQAKLEEKTDGIGTRLGILENRTTLQVNWFLGIITALVGGLWAVIGKNVFFQ